jgi:GntR family transcriptional regulator, uxu operon transcriptional repressor
MPRIAPPPHHPPPEARLYRTVASRVAELIREQDIRPGQRLPSERDLAATLGVSRTSLREAVIALELGGVVAVHGGSGVYVNLPPEPQADMPERGAGPFEVLKARRLIESDVCAMAARVASDSAIDAILDAALAMEVMHDVYASNEEADRNFHLAIARATGNSAMVGAVEYLWGQRGRLWHKLKERFQTEELRQQTLKDHRRILAAIVARDPAGARRAMQAHLERVTQTFSRG